MAIATHGHGANSNDLTRIDLEGLFAQFQVEEATHAWAQAVAPIVPVTFNSGRFYRVTSTELLRVDSALSPLQPIGFRDPLRASDSLTIGTTNYDVDRYSIGLQSLDDETAGEMAARLGLDVAGYWTRVFAQRGAAIHAELVANFLGASANYGASADLADLDTATTDLIGPVEVAKETIHLATDGSVSRFMAVYSPAVHRRLRLLDQVIGTSAIAGAGSGQRATDDQIMQFWKDIGVEHVEVARTVVRNASAANEYALGDHIAILPHAPGADPLDNFLATAAKGAERALGRVWTWRENNPPGDMIAADAAFDLVQATTARGYLLENVTS